MISRTDDLSDLPPQVLAQLGSVKRADLEDKILRLLEVGPLSVDQLLIALYRQHQLVLTRKYIVAKLYRMSVQGDISPVLGRKGVYLKPTEKN